MTLEKGQAVLESVLEYDPDTCQFIIARHPVEDIESSVLTLRSTTDSVARMNAPTSEDYESFSTTQEDWAPQDPGGGLSPAVHHCSEEYVSDHWGHQTLWFQDPPGLTVTKSDQNVHWLGDYNNFCVAYAYSYLLSQWLRASGWYLTTHYHDLYPLDDWRVVYGEGVQVMRNDAFGDVFCGGQSTYTHYNPNQIRMFYEGMGSFNWTYWAVGGCSDWLTPFRSAYAF